METHSSLSNVLPVRAVSYFPHWLSFLVLQSWSSVRASVCPVQLWVRSCERGRVSVRNGIHGAHRVAVMREMLRLALTVVTLMFAWKIVCNQSKDLINTDASERPCRPFVGTWQLRNCCLSLSLPPCSKDTKECMTRDSDDSGFQNQSLLRVSSYSLQFTSISPLSSQSWEVNLLLKSHQLPSSPPHLPCAPRPVCILNPSAGGHLRRCP